MNKLTLAAAVALTLGATVKAAECNDTPITKPCDPAAYNFDVSLKTTVAKGKSVKASVCDDTAAGYSCYRVKGSKSLKGWVVLCSCWCAPQDGVIVTVTTNGWISPDGTETNTTQVTDDDIPLTEETTTIVPGGGGYGTSTDWVAYLWDKKAKKYYAYGDEFTWELAGVFGKKKGEFEGVWTMEASGGDVGGEWAGAGYGEWIRKDQRLKSAHGTIVATLEAPKVENKKAEEAEDCECQAPLLDPCTLEADDSAGTVGWGTWKMKYNAKASKTYANSGISSLLPNF